VLKKGGRVFLAEVRSRVEGEAGKKEAFLGGLSQMGFRLEGGITSDTMFFSMVLRKSRQLTPHRLSQAQASLPPLLPCEYRKR